MRHALHCHPINTDTVVSDIFVTIERISAATLQLRYRVRGDSNMLRVPPALAAQRCDELWRHTCAELFVATADAEPYCEFNFAPSTQWAAYGFSAYRQGMQQLDCAAPLIKVTLTESQLLIETQVHLPQPFAAQARLQLGISMVIEESSGRSYWALAHAVDRPDFHHRSGFVLNV
jgi:hypothetical protein